jgi:hypothetical protein
MTITIPDFPALILQSFLCILAAKAIIAVVMTATMQRSEGGLMLLIFGYHAVKRLFWTLLAAINIAAVVSSFGLGFWLLAGASAVAAGIGTVIPLARR